jgi:hypothetical protein
MGVDVIGWHQRYFKEPELGCDLSVGFEMFIKMDEEVYVPFGL